MQAENFVNTVERFVADIMGFLIPGAGFLIGAWLVTPGELIERLSDTRFSVPPSSAGEWVVAIVVSYGLGFIFNGVFDSWITKSLETLILQSPRHKGTAGRFGWRHSVGIIAMTIPPAVEPEKKFQTKQESKPTVMQFKAVLRDRFGFDYPSVDFRELRNIALSFASEKRETYRFSYMATMSGGLAMASLTTAALLGVLMALSPMRGANDVVNIGNEAAWWFLPLLLGAWFLVDRRYRFYSITMRIPFSVAVVALMTADNTVNSTD